MAERSIGAGGSGAGGEVGSGVRRDVRGVAGVGNAEQRGILFMGSSINSYKYPRYSLKTFVVERKI